MRACVNTLKHIDVYNYMFWCKISLPRRPLKYSHLMAVFIFFNFQLITLEGRFVEYQSTDINDLR